jgi:hypothetical protein
VDETPSQHEAVEAVGEALSAIRESSIADLEIEWEGGSLRILREPGTADASPGASLAVAAPIDERVMVIAEHVGVFHGGAGGAFPGAGTWVSAGTRLGEIETLGMRNGVTARIDGWVHEVLANDGAAVEYGQQLAIMRPESRPPDPRGDERSSEDAAD